MHQTVLDFTAALAKQQDVMMKQQIAKYIDHLKNTLEPKNGGFPDTPLMKKQLLSYMTYVFDTLAARNFDKISD